MRARFFILEMLEFASTFRRWATASMLPFCNSIPLTLPKGNCKFGLRCAYEHIIADGRRASKSLVLPVAPGPMPAQALPRGVESDASSSSSDVITNNFAYEHASGSRANNFIDDTELPPLESLLLRQQMPQQAQNATNQQTRNGQGSPTNMIGMSPQVMPNIQDIFEEEFDIEAIFSAPPLQNTLLTPAPPLQNTLPTPAPRPAKNIQDIFEEFNIGAIFSAPPLQNTLPTPAPRPAKEPSRRKRIDIMAMLYPEPEPPNKKEPYGVLPKANDRAGSKSSSRSTT